jgi:hypothetical protein
LHTQQAAESEMQSATITRQRLTLEHFSDPKEKFRDTSSTKSLLVSFQIPSNLYNKPAQSKNKPQVNARENANLYAMPNITEQIDLIKRKIERPYESPS